MGWETRNGKKVYYRKLRGASGRVRSIYCGSGERGELAAREDAERRSTRGGGGNSPHKKKARADDLPAEDAAHGASENLISPRARVEADEPRAESSFQIGQTTAPPPPCSTSDLAEIGDIKTEPSPARPLPGACPCARPAITSWAGNRTSP